MICSLLLLCGAFVNIRVPGYDRTYVVNGCSKTIGNFSRTAIIVSNSSNLIYNGYLNESAVFISGSKMSDLMFTGNLYRSQVVIENLTICNDFSFSGSITNSMIFINSIATNSTK